MAKKVEDLFDLSKLSESSIRKYQVKRETFRVTFISIALILSLRPRSRTILMPTSKSIPMRSLKNCWNLNGRKKEGKLEVPGQIVVPLDSITISMPA